MEKFPGNLCHRYCHHFVELFAVFALENFYRCRILQYYRFEIAKKLTFHFLDDFFFKFPANLLFYGMNALEFIGFLALSLHWPDLMRQFQMVESLPVFRNCTYKTMYMRRIRFISSIALFLALGSSCSLVSFAFKIETLCIKIGFLIGFSVEHFLCVGATVHSILIYHSDKDILTELIRSLVPHLVPRSERLPTYLALLICCINESATFVWNFLDIFLMIVGIGLSTHFKVLNNKLEHTAMEMEVKFESRNFFLS